MKPEHAVAAVADSQLISATGSVRWGHSEQNADLLDALGVALDDDDSVHSALRTMVTLAMEAIDGAASCGVTIVVARRTFTVVHSDARTLLVDAEQYAAGDGPCLQAARTGEVVRADSMAATAQWPVFVDAARRENIHSFLAAPLYAGDTRFGSLNLYGEQESAFTDSDVATATALTRTLSRTLGDYQRFDRLLDQYNGLRIAIDHRAPIEQAKGMLMAIHRIDAEAAFTMLADHSMAANRKLRDLAVELVESVIHGTPDAVASDSGRSLLDPAS